MKKLIDLKFLFTTVAIVELCYVLLTILPPSLIGPVNGWVLLADGQWIVKILCMSLAFQAYIAWIYRKDTPVAVAKGLAFYQITSATMDWVMWISLNDDGIFSTDASKIIVPIAIISHYIIGFLLIWGISKQNDSH